MVSEDQEVEIPEEEYLQLQKDAEGNGQDPAEVPKTRTIRVKVKRQDEPPQSN